MPLTTGECGNNYTNVLGGEKGGRRGGGYTQIVEWFLAYLEALGISLENKRENLYN